MNNSVIVFGTGVLAKTAIDIFNSNGLLIYGLLDENPEKEKEEIGNVTVLGNLDDPKFLKILGKETAACIAIENSNIRASLVKTLLKDYKVVPMNAIHRKASVSEDALIGHGNIMASGVSIEAFSEIGSHCIIRNNANINIGAKLGDFVEVGSGAIINDNVIIEDGAFIGSGAILVSGITIGKNARVGAGSVVIENIKDKTTVFGNPAKKV